MKLIKKVGIGLVSLLIGFLIYVALQPSEYMVARDILVKAPAEKIFPHINNNKKAVEWMPWYEVDTDLEMQYTGPSEGVGATSIWESQGQMGAGRSEVVESVANQRVKTQLTYTKPMQMSQLAEVSLTPTSDGTKVRWSVSGNNSFLGKLMCSFMDMDKMVGGMFEKGLTKLKNQVESLP